MARPKNPLLSRDIIADAALRLVDREGPDSLTMRRIAKELEVHPSSLYNHFSSRLELIEEIRGIVSAQIDARPLRSKPWSEGVIEWAHSYRSTFSRHPRVITVLMSAPASSPIVLTMYETFTETTRAAGWPEEDILPMLTALESFILGSVLDMSGPAAMFDPRGQEEQFPAFTRAFAAASRHDLSETNADRAFELGLRGLVNGFASGRAI